MRLITQKSTEAFLNKRKFKRQNMKVDQDSSTGFWTLYLHDNAIAYFDGNGKLWISSAGWETVTTKERLNALPNVDLYQKNFVWYLNGEAWKNSHVWTEVA